MQTDNVNKACLAARSVTVSFEGLVALSGVTMCVEPASVVGLIGPNGAGKTTFVNVLTGFQTPTSGTVEVDGQEIGGQPSYDIRRRKIARTFQAGRLFAGLDVLDNLAVTGVGLGYNRRESEAEALRILAWMDAMHLADLSAAGLPYTDERRVGIARALMFNPTYLLLDEPAAGMSEAEADQLANLIRRIVEDIGCGVLLIEHNVGLVLDVSNHVYVLDTGRLIEEGDRDVIMASQAVRDAYLGADQEVA